MALSVAEALTKRDRLLGVTTTVETGTRVTVIEALPDLPSLMAVTVAVPGLTPVACPVDEIRTTLVSLELHDIGLPARVFPAASRAVATRVCVWSTRSVTLPGITSTDVTDTGPVDEGSPPPHASAQPARPTASDTPANHDKLRGNPFVMANKMEERSG
jgi:hypothetical protein